MVDLGLKELRDAEALIEVTIAKLGKEGGGCYVGSLREYKRLVKTYLRLRAISREIEKGEDRVNRKWGA